MPRKIESGDIFACFVFLGLLAIMFISYLTVENSRTSETLITHNISLNVPSRLEFLWVKTVFICPSYPTRMLAGTSGKVFFIGNLKLKCSGGLIALDGETGDKLWAKNENRFGVHHTGMVEVGNETVYIDYSGSVIAYDFNGKKLWRTHAWANNLSSITAIGGKLYVTAYDYYLVDAVTGKLLATSSETYIFDKKFNRELSWDFGNMSAFADGLVFTLHDWKNVAIAYNATGKILWWSEDNVISNVVGTEKLAFFITYDDELRILNAQTGKLLEIIRIEPSIDYFGENATVVQHAGYFLAVDQTTQTLYVLLGDSNQLFAFRIHE